MHFRLAYLTENVMAFLSHSPSKTSSVHQRSSHLIRCNITSAVETASLNNQGQINLRICKSINLSKKMN